MKNERNWGEDEARNSIEYGYINGKANTKKLAVEIVDEMYETQGQMIEILILTGFKSKPAKNIAGYLGIVNELLAIYGIKRMKYLKPYLNEVVRIVSTEKLPAVKNEGMNVLKNAYKWMTKDVVEPMLKDIKENIKSCRTHGWRVIDTNHRDIVRYGQLIHCVEVTTRMGRDGTCFIACRDKCFDRA